MLQPIFIYCNKPIRDCVVNEVGLQVGLPNSVHDIILVLVEGALSSPGSRPSPFLPKPRSGFGTDDPRFTRRSRTASTMHTAGVYGVRCIA